MQKVYVIILILSFFCSKVNIFFVFLIYSKKDITSVFINNSYTSYFCICSQIYQNSDLSIQ